MSARPPLTIGLPVHNGATHLAEALDALLAQTYGDFEVVAADNASTDETPDILRDYARRDRRIRWTRHRENRGAAFNYNFVAAQRTEGLFKWASHDDLHAPRHLERCIEALEAGGPAVVLAYPRTVLIDGEGWELGAFDDRLDLRDPRPARRLRDFAMRWRLANVVFGVIRAEVLHRTHLVRPYVSSDLTLIAELALRGQFHEVPEPLFLRRVHAGSSRRGTLTLAAVAQWFDPGAGGRPVVPPLLRVWASTVRVLATAPDVALVDRALASAVYAESWAERRVRARIGRVRRRHTRPMTAVAQAGPPVS